MQLSERLRWEYKNDLLPELKKREIHLWKRCEGKTTTLRTTMYMGMHGWRLIVAPPLKYHVPRENVEARRDRAINFLLNAFFFKKRN